MDVRGSWDNLLDRWDARRPLSDHVRDGRDAALDRWVDLPLAGRVGLGAAGAVAVVSLGVVAFLLVQPLLKVTDVTTTTTTVSTQLGSTTSVDLNQLLESPVTVELTTTSLPEETSTSRTTRTTRRSAPTRPPTPTTRRPPSPPTTRPPSTATTRPPTTPPTTAAPTTPPPSTA